MICRVCLFLAVFRAGYKSMNFKEMPCMPYMPVYIRARTCKKIIKSTEVYLKKISAREGKTWQA